MRKNDTYLLDILLRIPGALIYSENDGVFIRVSTTESYRADTISECLDLIRESFAHKWARRMYSMSNLHKMSQEEFVIALKEQEDRDEIKAIEMLCGHMYDLIKERRYAEIDELADLIIKHNLGLKVIITFLTVSHSSKGELKTIDSIIEYAKAIAKKDGLTDNQISNLLWNF